METRGSRLAKGIDKMSNSNKSALPQKKNCMALQMVRCESPSMSPSQLEANRRKKELEMAEERKKKQSMNDKANRKYIESLDSTPVEMIYF